MKSTEYYIFETILDSGRNNIALYYVIQNMSKTLYGDFEDPRQYAYVVDDIFRIIERLVNDGSLLPDGTLLYARTILKVTFKGLWRYHVEGTK